MKELQNIKAPSSAPKVNAQGNNHRRPSVESPEVANAKCSEEDLTTWTHLSLDCKGAVLHTIDLGEDGSESHRRIGQYYPNIPREEEQAVKITLKEVEVLKGENHLAEEARKDAEWELVSLTIITSQFREYRKSLVARSFKLSFIY